MTASGDTTVIEDRLHERADEFVSRLDDSERIDWLRDQGVTEDQVLDQSTSDDLDETCRDLAHEVAADAANGELMHLPEWLT